MQTLDQYFASSFSVEELAIIAAIAVATMAVAALVRGWGSRVAVLIGGLILIIVSSSTLRFLPFIVLALMVTQYADSRKPVEAAARYRLVVELEVDGQLVEGSAVQEVQFLHYPTSRGNDQIKTRIEGNALLIPLPDHETLLISMRLMPNKNLPYTTFFTTACDIRRAGFESVGDFIRRLAEFSGRCAVKETSLPMMFLISDTTSRPAVRYVRNMSGPNNPITPGVFFKAAYVESTTLQVSSGIEVAYPWMTEAFNIRHEQFGRQDWLGDDEGYGGGYKGDVDGALGF